jgi:tetratricopeptide (TPR) repeat protein
VRTWISAITLGVAILTGNANTWGQSANTEFESYAARAAQAQSIGDTQGAIAAYKAALALQPQVAEMWSNLGLMQDQIRDDAGAIASFTQAHRLKPKLFVPVLFLGLEDLKSGKTKEALAYLEEARRISPGDPNLPMYLGQAYLGLKQFKQAAAAYSEVVHRDPKNGEAWYRLGLSHLEIAEADASEMATRFRDSPYFLVLEGDTLASQESFERAAKIFGEALQAERRPPCVRSALGFVQLRQGKLEEANNDFLQDKQAGGCSIAQLGLLRTAFARDRDRVDLTPLGSLWMTDPEFVKNNLSQMTAGLSAEEFAVLERAFDRTHFVELNAEDVAHMKRALHSVASERTDVKEKPAATLSQARTDYIRGQYTSCTNILMPSLAALSREKLSLLAACAYASGEFNSALAAGEKLKRLPGAQDGGLYWSIRSHQSLGVQSLIRAGEADPNSVHLHQLLAESYRNMGRYGDAESEYAVALNIDANDFATLLGAAATYLQEYRLQPAREMIDRALRQKPSDPEANYILGEILVDQHQFDEAEAPLKTGLSSKMELLPRIHALLGRVYASQGKDEQAIAELKLGLPSDDDGSVHFQLGRLYQKSGQQKLAQAAFDETKRLQNKH